MDTNFRMVKKIRLESMPINGCKRKKEETRERDVDMTWREIKWTSNSSRGETERSEESFRQIDGDEGEHV